MKRIDTRMNYIDILYSASKTGRVTVCSPTCNVIFSTQIIAGENRFLTIAIPQNVVWASCHIQGPCDFQITAAKERTDFFDFYNFKQQYETPKIVTSKKYQKQISSIHSGVTFFVTYHCTYKCPFCWQLHGGANYAEQKSVRFDSDILASVFNKLMPSFIYFTGGEPTLYKDLFLMVSKLDSQIKCRITSNFGPSFDVENFISHIAPDRFEMLMFSYHPSGTTQKLFLNKLDRLISSGFTNILVESVLYSDDIPSLVAIKDELIARNIICRYDTCTLPGGEVHTLSPKYVELAHLLQQQGKIEQIKSAVPLQQSGNILANKSALILCPAGHKSFHIDPAGDIYPCMSALDRSKLFGKWALPHYQSMGNIQDPNFTYFSEPIFCWEAFRCSACDYETLQAGWHLIDKKHPPIPE